MKKLDSFISALDKLEDNFKDYIVYNPLKYAYNMHCEYLKKSTNHGAKMLFLGMNPGPYGMMQNGVPFGAVNAVKNYLKITNDVKPFCLHEKHNIIGLETKRDEVSGKKLWSLMESLYKDADELFKHITVQNYCPLAFLDSSGKNIALNNVKNRKALEELCDQYLKEYILDNNIKTAVGVGVYAFDKLNSLNLNIKVIKVLHPSPLNPLAHKGWAEGVINAIGEDLV